jgi:hypothetical protein
MVERLGLRPEIPRLRIGGTAPTPPIGAPSPDDARARSRRCASSITTSTGVVSDIAAYAAIDAARHPALLLVDVSSLASIDFRMDDWASTSPSAAHRRG